MSDLLEYKGYHGTVEYSAEDGILCGSVFGVNDSLNYHGMSLEELEASFHSCIDNYFALCARTGKQPEKERTGCFNRKETLRQQAITMLMQELNKGEDSVKTDADWISEEDLAAEFGVELTIGYL